MKHFTKTAAGKTILFIVCAASVCMLAASIVGIFIYTGNGEIDFYRYPEAEIIARLLEDGGPLERVGENAGIYMDLIHIAYALRYAVYYVAFGSLVLAVISFAALMYASGRRPDTDELSPGPLNRIPFDLLFAVCLIIMAVICEPLRRCNDYIAVAVCAFGIFLAGTNLFLAVCMSAAARVKQHTFVKNTIIYRLIMRVWKLLCFVWSRLKKINMVWRTALVFGAISFLELLVISAAERNTQVIVVMWLAEKVILLPVILTLALTLRKLQQSGRALAGGDLSYHTDTQGMLWDLKEHGENMNRIAEGMSIAVEERLKSERMKTELITNVSHDIKTPVTSIINYASLIAAEQSENGKIAEYSEVLVRQSEKLKRLVDDLVEASKASTGNLEVFPVPCDAGTFLTQAAGEYEEKMQKAELTLVTKQPEKELRIMADGRRMWRIFDNLMNNICKYAQPGTRVYLSLEEQDGNAVISFKNTSREPLDMTEEELMERFTRGDSSRNTEGNGLGLSIAGSLTELQGGTLHLSTDGDLFKATLGFPLI